MVQVLIMEIDIFCTFLYKKLDPTICPCGLVGLGIGLSLTMYIVTFSGMIEYAIIVKTRDRQACRDDYVHDVHTAGLHTSDRLFLEAVREVNLFDHAGIRTGDPRSDRRQVQ